MLGFTSIMTYQFKPMTNSEYLSFVNREDTPGPQGLRIEYVEYGNKLFAYAFTAVGKLVSAQMPKDPATTEEEITAFFDTETEKLKEDYERKKASAIAPNFLAFGNSK